MAGQSRKAALVGSLAAGSVVVVALAVSVFNQEPETRIVTGSNPPLPVAVPGVPVLPGKAAPDTVVAVRSIGEVALLDSGDGATVRVLATHAPEALGSLALTPDRRHAYYAVGSPCGSSALYRVALDGRTPPEPVGPGISPAVSPDGHTLAYARPTPPGGCANTVVVRDLATGGERSWGYPDDPDHQSALYVDGSISRLAWAPDSRRLAYTLSYEGDTVAVLDTVTHSDLAQTTEVVVPGGGGDSRHPVWQASTGRLAVVNSVFACCYDDDYAGPPRTLAIDLPSRKVENLLAPGKQPQWLDFDLTGHHLLYVEDGRLYRRTDTGRAKLVGAGITAADW